MKYFISFLAFCFLLSSCDTTTSEVENKQNDSTLLNPLDMVAAELPKVSDDLDVNDFVAFPFTVMGPPNQLGAWTEIDKVYSNDTLRTIRFKDSEFRVMNHTYVDATIYDKELKLVHNIYVGMSRAEFESRFSNIEESDNKPYVKKSENSIVLSCCADLELYDKWEFEFHKDTLDLIKFDHYVDMDLEFPNIENSPETL